MLELNTQVTVYYVQDKQFHASPAKVIGRSFSARPTYDVLLEHGAVLLNITPDHLDRHGTMENYAAVKARIFAGQGRGDHAVIGVDDDWSARICAQVSARGDVGVAAVSVGKVLGRGVHVMDGVLVDATGAASRPVLDLKTLAHLPGAHNWQHLAIAYAAVKPLVRDPGSIAGAMPSFPGLAHRIETVGTLEGVRFVNDSKATNADAAARALACVDNIHWIDGGKAKEGGIDSLSSFHHWLPLRSSRSVCISRTIAVRTEVVNSSISNSSRTTGSTMARVCAYMSRTFRFRASLSLSTVRSSARYA